MVLSVEEADKQADELLKKMYPEQYPDDEEDDNKDEGEDKTDGDEKEEPETDAGDKAESSKTDEDDKAAEEDTKAKSEDTGWEQRYKVLKGKYDKEVPDLHRTIRQLQEDVQELRASLKTKREEKKATLEEEKTTDPDIAYLEEEFPDIHRAVSKMLSKGKPDEKVVERLSSVEARQAEEAKTKFFKDLTEEVPDWQNIRDDERFTEWLNEIDDLTEAPRFQLAVIAQNNLNGKQLAKFYKRFKSEYNIGNSDNGSGKSEKDLEKHTGMPKSKSGKQPDTKGKESDIVTREDIRKFYKDAASGKYVGDEEAFKKMEAKIHRAMQDGRIQ
jgi:hypothetical protein